MSQASSSVASSEPSTLEYEQESFASFHVKVIQLCIDIGLGEPSEVERMSGGIFNRVIGITFSSPQTSRYVVRIPRILLKEVDVRKIYDQVAVLRYLSAYVPVAKVTAYDCTTENAIESQYVIQERLLGQTIEAIYNSLILEEKLQLASAFAEIFKKIDSVLLPRFGRLVQDAPMPEVSDAVSQQSKDEMIKLVGFRPNEAADALLTEETSLSSLLQALCKIRSLEGHRQDKVMQSYWQRLQQMIAEMESIGFFSGIDEKPRLWHWDLSAQNIFVNKVAGVWTISGVLDWDDALSVPGVIGRKAPVWLWQPNVHAEDADTVETTLLTADQTLIKKRFEEVITSSLPSFLDDAYHRGRWLRRIMAFALQGFSCSQDWDRYKTLIHEWEIHYEALSKDKHV